MHHPLATLPRTVAAASGRHRRDRHARPAPGRHERRYVFLDNAASTPALASVMQAVTDFMPWYSGVHRGTGFKSLLATEAFDAAHDMVGAVCRGRSGDEHGDFHEEHHRVHEQDRGPVRVRGRRRGHHDACRAPLQRPAVAAARDRYARWDHARWARESCRTPAGDPVTPRASESGCRARRLQHHGPVLPHPHDRPMGARSRSEDRRRRRPACPASSDRDGS